ncbi:carbonic anhydrase [Flavobacterium arcticum]|uniref:Carbonic anhydrase 2 n=1 Tax=Flavobacterium arcticum TaxID=1784713 RepID=A0A345H8A4_9FLAO|nr:carbonic anhydrase [Flavobacterium arcticum]AXG72814.1 carbonic anhydrase [Flavobacterium arcticum]KAF2510521.1 carbonic anhydrase [Flavobacterium arcticum]
MNIKKVFENNKNWVAQQLQKDPEYFNNLSQGQSPEILYIGCSDSRVAAEELMGVRPGDIFVHRNIANMVPNTDLNSMSVINYAVVHLKVKHIIVCGHTNCGGIKAAMHHTDMGILNPWLRNIRDVYRLHRNELDAIENETDRYDRLVELNVQEQCINVIKTAEVQKAATETGLTVHGWIFDLQSGKLIDLNIDFEKITQDIVSIYRIRS